MFGTTLIGWAQLGCYAPTNFIKNALFDPPRLVWASGHSPEAENDASGAEQHTSHSRLILLDLRLCGMWGETGW